MRYRNRPRRDDHSHDSASAHHAVLTGRAPSGDLDVSAPSYCQGGTNDPGQTVAVSRVESTLQATLPG